jgi:hypothetical protein
MTKGRADQRHENAMQSLHPVFAMQVKRLLADLHAKGWQPVLVYGTRTEQQQADLYKKGYGAKFSWHVASHEKRIPSADGMAYETVRGCAADIIDRRWGWGGPCLCKDHQFWKDLGSTAKKHGLEWGGDWKKRDVAHVQMKIIEDRIRTTMTA